MTGTILVTGGSGYIAGFLIRQLIDALQDAIDPPMNRHASRFRKQVNVGSSLFTGRLQQHVDQFGSIIRVGRREGRDS